MRWLTVLPPLLLAAACGDEGPAGGSSFRIQAVGDSEVAGTPLDTVAGPLQVRVTDLLGRPREGVRVTWSTADGGSLLPEGPVTDELGTARAEWVLGWRPGRQEARATLGEGQVAVFTATAEGFQAIGLSVGDGDHQCGINPAGNLFCWGPNDDGQLGDGTTTPSEVPVPVQLEHQVQQAGTSYGAWAPAAIRQGRSSRAENDDFSCALTTAGEVYCWGGNNGGQLGNGTFSPSRSPIRPGLPAGRYRTISVREGGVCAVGESGEAYCWGANREGRFGLGRGESLEPIPARIAADFSWRQVALGDDRACGVREGGQVYCWGARPEWLGIDSDTATVLPLPVLESVPMDSVTLSGWHQCGVTAAGVTYCWGHNFHIGFLTTDTLIPYPQPLEVPPALRSVHSLFKPTFGLGTDAAGYWWGPPVRATGGGPRTPEQFSGEIPLRAIGTKEAGVCGVEETTGTVYCWTTKDGFDLARVSAVPRPAGPAAP